MFVVPVGVLFAFTSIRANLPGAPDGFGLLKFFCPFLTFNPLAPTLGARIGVVHPIYFCCLY
jgi:hypothetical protein